MLVVAKRQAHIGLLISILADGNACLECDLAEVTFAIILVEIISACVIRLKNIQMATAIKVGPHHC